MVFRRGNDDNFFNRNKRNRGRKTLIYLSVKMIDYRKMENRKGENKRLKFRGDEKQEGNEIKRDFSPCYFYTSDFLQKQIKG